MVLCLHHWTSTSKVVDWNVLVPQLTEVKYLGYRANSLGGQLWNGRPSDIE